MAIEILNEAPDEALTFNRIWMLDLKVSQKLLVKNDDEVKFSVTVTYRKYAVDSNDTIHYRTKTDMIVIDDYLPEAMAKAAQGDMDLINALGAIELAVSKIIEEKRGLTVSVV